MSEINDTREITEGNLLINLKLIEQHQQKDPRLLYKYKSNIDLKLIMCKDKIVITSILQSYVLHWDHTYILHPGMDRTEVTIIQHLYLPIIIKPVQK